MALSRSTAGAQQREGQVTPATDSESQQSDRWLPLQRTLRTRCELTGEHHPSQCPGHRPKTQTHRPVAPSNAPPRRCPRRHQPLGNKLRTVKQIQHTASPPGRDLGKLGPSAVPLNKQRWAWALTTSWVMVWDADLGLPHMGPEPEKKLLSSCPAGGAFTLTLWAGLWLPGVDGFGAAACMPHDNPKTWSDMRRPHPPSPLEEGRVTLQRASFPQPLGSLSAHCRSAVPPRGG